MMKFSLLIFSVIAIVTASSDVEKWNEFKIKFNKNYSSLEEEARRYLVFQENLRIIEQHNQKFLKGETKHKMGVTRFADITQEEFFDKDNTKLPRFNKYDLNVEDPQHLKGYCIKELYKPKLINSSFSDNVPPASIDYRDKGVVLPPRDMGNRTADVAFAVAATLEVSLALLSKTPVYLSPQYLIDCSENSVSSSYFRVFYNGLPLDSDYPLIEGKGECREICDGVCIGYNILAHESIIETVVGLATAVTIWIDGGDLALYESGIIDGSNCYFNPDWWWQPDTSKWRKPWSAVVIGYGSENGTDYWIVKNSWGTSWGKTVISDS